MVQFRENGAVYEAVSTVPFILIENEPWYPGWRAMLCEQNNCLDIVAKAQLEVLRSWNIPAGSWKVITYFKPPGWDLAKIITRVSLLMLLLIMIAIIINDYLLSHPAKKSSTRRQHD